MLRVAVVGASGYTGAELVRILTGHPGAELSLAIGKSRAGEALGAVLPSLRGLHSPTGEAGPWAVEAWESGDAVAERADVAFCALPHGASAPMVDALRAAGVVVIDLSADFRLRDLDSYTRWYGEHGAPERRPEAVYGLVELYREELRQADLVAVPGCYPTATVLALAAPLRAKLLQVDRAIVVDAKSGVSGAGRVAKPRTHFSETAESFRAYAIAGHHRHTPEMEQELSAAAGAEVRVVFSPHLVPMIRGILSTAYAEPAPGVDAEACTRAARELYEGSPAVVVLEPGECPDTQWARGANRAFVSYTQDKRSGVIVAQCAIDNLVKGAAGQAVQAMNVRFGLDESAGLRLPAMWP